MKPELVGMLARRTAGRVKRKILRWHDASAPEPVFPTCVVDEPVRWGIMGCGKIAEAFADDLSRLPQAELTAAGSRSQKKAAAFAAAFGGKRGHAGYDDLISDPEVEVIYIATPHMYHEELTLACLEGGKHVLCEKPVAINAVQAQRMADKAKESGLFLMDAMWSRFIPLYSDVRAWLASGVIGDVRMVTASFGFRAPMDPKSRLFNLELGGGSLLDVGIYPIALAAMVFGCEPERVAGFADIGETGVDEQAGFTLGYSSGRLAVLSSALRTAMHNDARIMGTDGCIELRPPFWCPHTAVLHRAGREPEVIKKPVGGHGYGFEAAHVMECLRAGLKESPLMPFAETIGIARTMDRLRESWGLSYPCEEVPTD